MKLRVSVALPQGGTQDITLSCTVTTTAADVARSLIRAGLGPDPQLAESACRRLGAVTLRASNGPGTNPVLLDPMSPIAVSGLHSGQVIQPVPEFGAPGGCERLVEVAGIAEVLGGEQRGAQFSLIVGDNLIGRDRSCRVQLLHRSISRRHACVVIEPDGSLTISDLGSANGIIHEGERYDALRIVEPAVLRFGDIDIRITPGPPARPAPPLSHRVMHTRSPRVAPRFAASDRELPKPPTPGAPHRVPTLAMLAPVLMGGAMYAVTRSPMSLMMVAFTPVMMIGSWLDGTLGSRRKRKSENLRFSAELASEREELRRLREEEIAVRAAETPNFDDVRAAIEQRGELLWTRRPEHRSFLEVRFGEGAQPSRTRTIMPERGEASREQWEQLRRIAAEFDYAAPVPVIERFGRCGSIGVAGPGYWAEGAAASLVLQLAGLHSPHELVLACFADPSHDRAWAWLKWLPHVDPVASPIPVWQLADSASSSLRLLTALEGLLEMRKAVPGAGGVIRSHLESQTREAASAGDPVQSLPTTPSVIVLVLEDRLLDPARLIELAETGPDYGIHIIWVTCDRALLPAACRTFVEVDRGEGRVHFVRSSRTVHLSRFEHVDPMLAHHLARRMAPVEDTAARVLDESDLPKNVDLRELHGTDLLGGRSPIVQSWARGGSLVSEWTMGHARGPISLAGVVGQSPDGPAVIDLRVHGPHALVGGTTGAGKSEFLQSWIMSMAANVSPDRLAFLLVDYKGGAAFAECVDLPHTVGLVTDLSPRLVRRALTSLRAELRYREALLAAHGAKDLIAMERNSDAAAPPVLVIVIDEFAALAGDIPAFVDGVIDIAQRGRSLGLHLIMATQRPAGVVTDNLRANTNLRIALRMADESDSADVIGVKDAAFFGADAPGRGAIKIGAGRITHFQTGYLGGRASNGRETAEIEVRPLGFAEGEPWNIPVEPHPEGRGRPRLRDIERLRDGIVEAARHLRLARPRRPWLDELPTSLGLAELGGRPDGDVGDGAAGTLFGLRDDPAAQAQHPVRIDFEEVGNVSILGAGGTGKTSALITLAAALSGEAATDPVQIYAIDAAGGALDTIAPLPTVGTVAPLADTELMTRVLRHLRDTIVERGPRYAAVRACGLDSYRAATRAVVRAAAGPGRGRPEPRVFLLLDGFAAFRQATETVGGADSPFQLLSEIMLQGRAVGVHIVLTGDRPSTIPATMGASVQQQFVLRLANPHDYGALDVSADTLECAPPGRALLARDAREIQLAHIGALDAGGADLAGQAAGIEALAAALQAQFVEPAPRIVNAPEQLPLHELPPLVRSRAVYGIDALSLAPAVLPLTGLGVISGPSGAGLSQAALCCVAAVERAAAEQGQNVDAVLLGFAENGLQHRRAWNRVAEGAEAVDRLAEALVIALGGRPAARSSALGGIGPPGYADPSGGATASGAANPPLVFPKPGARGVIVIERPVEAEGTAALVQLTALARAARRARVLVLFEFESGTAGAIWELYQALKQPTWGLALQPDQHETQTPFRENLGRVNRADFPPGRGFAIEHGRVTPVQVAIPSSETCAVPGTGSTAALRSVDSPLRRG